MMAEIRRGRSGDSAGRNMRSDAVVAIVGGEKPHRSSQKSAYRPRFDTGEAQDERGETDGLTSALFCNIKHVEVINRLAFPAQLSSRTFEWQAK
jgi:hypothetical protein